jgi:hypothetical protein
MKKLILVVVMMVAFVATGISQNLTAKTSRVYKAFGTVTDTINKDEALTYRVYVPNYAKYVKFNVVQDTISGPDLASTTTVLAYSYDNANWTNLDTVAVVGNTFGTSDLLLPYAQYLKFTITAIDSTAKVNPTLYFLIEKKE